MVHDERNLCAVKDLVKSSLFHLTDSNRAGDVVRQGQVDLCLDELARCYRVKSRMFCENFLSHCHCHSFVLDPLFHEEFVDAIQIRLDGRLDNIDGDAAASDDLVIAVHRDLNDGLALCVLAFGS